MWARRGRRKEAEPLPAVRALHLPREDLPERPRSHQVTAAEVVECSRFEAGLRISGAAIALFDSSEFSGNGSWDCGDGPFARPGGLTFRFSGPPAVADGGSRRWDLSEPRRSGQLGLDDPSEIIAWALDEPRDVDAVLVRERLALQEWLVALDSEGRFAAAGLD